jgi:hypothetical protein
MRTFGINLAMELFEFKAFAPGQCAESFVRAVSVFSGGQSFVGGAP